MAMAPAGGGGTGGGGSGFKLVFKLGKLGNPSAPTTAAPAPPAAPAPAPAPVTVQHQSPPPVVAPPQPVTSVHQSVALPRSDPVLPDPHPQFNSQKQHPAPTHASAPSVKTKAVSPHASVTPRQPPPPTPSSSTVPSQGSMLPPPPPIQSLPPHFSLFKAPKPRDEDREPDGSDERRVSAAKYRQLKRKYDNTLETQQDASAALLRAQRLITRLREEKTALLDRVLLLESAAGLSKDDVEAVLEEDVDNEASLLYPPQLPSTADRPRKLPVLTTSTDLSNSSYNAPLGPPPPPEDLPPRRRSPHVLSAIAADKLRKDQNARREAKGLPKPTFPAVAVLGLEGSNIAGLVERVLRGEQVQLSAVASGSGTSGKRKRETADKGSSSHSSGKGKGRASASSSSTLPAAVAAVPATSNVVKVDHLPNPFANAGAVPEAVWRNPPVPVISGSTTTSTSTTTPVPSAFPSPTKTTSPVVGTSGPGGGVAGGSTVPGTPQDVEMGDDEGIYDDEGYEDESSRKKAATTMTTATKPRKIKAQGITTGTFMVPFVQRNPDATPVLPVNVGVFNVRKIGVISTKPNYSTERYIFPIGFESTRKYASMLDPNGMVEYVSRIADGGDSPRFEITVSDQPGLVISAGTPTGAWAQVVKVANKIRQRNHSNSVSGPDYYGLAHNIVKALIQELPNAQDVPSYVWQNFVEEPDPSTMNAEEARALKKSLAGASRSSKIVGKRRKGSGVKMEDNDDEDPPIHQHEPTFHYETNDGPYSRSPSTVHHGSPGVASPLYQQGDPFTTNSINTMFQAAASNPYVLPPPVVDDVHSPQLQAFGAMPLYDPYALPPAQPVHQSPTLVAGGSPSGGWGSTLDSPNAAYGGGSSAWRSWDGMDVVGGGLPLGQALYAGQDMSRTGSSSSGGGSY